MKTTIDLTLEEIHILYTLLHNAIVHKDALGCTDKDIEFSIKLKKVLSDKSRELRTV